MANNYYMSIGYPIGILELEEFEKNFKVKLGNELVGLSSNALDVWRFCFFDIKSEQDIKNTFKGKDFDDFVKLKEAKLIVEIDVSNINDAFNTLRKFSPSKNGYGYGIIDNDKYSILFQAKEIKIEVFEFLIWADCDNRLTIGDLYRSGENGKTSEEIRKQLLVNAILKLKTLGLINLNLRQKKEK